MAPVHYFFNILLFSADSTRSKAAEAAVSRPEMSTFSLRAKLYRGLASPCQVIAPSHDWLRNA